MPEEVNRPNSDNPFQSTSAEAKPTEASWHVPLSLVIGCALFCLAFNLLLLIPASNSFYVPPSRNFMMALSGGIYGVGVALFLYSVSTGQFSRLMPGHWRLIASSTMLVGELFLLGILLFKESPPRTNDNSEMVLNAFMVAHLTAGMFYLLVIKYCRESGIWRSYAWLAMIYCFVAALLYPYSNGRVESDFLIPSIVIDRLLIIALAVTYIAAIIDDYRKGTKRDFYHYLGILLGFLMLPFPALLAFLL